MNRQWQQVSLEEAKQHPLYGVKNWLAVFAFGVLLIPLRELGGLSGAAQDAGMTLTQLLAQNEAFGMYVKAVLALQTLMLVAIYWLMFTKHRSFRAATSAILFCYWPAVSLFALVTQAPGVGGTIGQGLISWVISCAVWVTYLQRSLRVRVTFENCVAVEKARSELQPAEPMPHVPQADTVTAKIVGRAELTSPSPSRVKTPSVKPIANAPKNPSEDMWAASILEFDGHARRPGLWARVFAEAQGNEIVAKASYLRYRAEELLQADEAMLLQKQSEAKEEAVSKLLAAQSAERHLYALLPKGMCPNCKATVLLLDAKKCTKCFALFTDLGDWRPIPIDEKQEEAVLKAAFSKGVKLTIDEVIFLTNRSFADKSIVKLMDKNRKSLVDKATELGLQDEVKTLLANGADEPIKFVK